MAPAMTVGQLIRQWRTDAKMSQRELADKVKVTFPHISKIESDKEQASAELLERIAKALGKTPEEADELFAAAGRLPSDVAEKVKSDPTQAFLLLRRMTPNTPRAERRSR